MVLSELLVRRNYDCYKIDGVMIAKPNPQGKYNATSVEEVGMALTNRKQQFDVLVRLGKRSKRWRLLPRS